MLNTMKMELEKTAKVSLVGAGPGAKDLITIRGLKVLNQADIILYDALIYYLKYVLIYLRYLRVKDVVNIRIPKMKSMN